MAFLSFTKGSTVTLDESAGLQNAVATAGVLGDMDDNDIAPTSLPTAFATRLSTLGAATATKVALSGYDGTNTGTNAFTFSVTGFVGMNFGDSTGAPLTGLDSGLKTVDGSAIFLYTDTGTGSNNNILLGKTSAGVIVFAAYLEETGSPTVTGAKLWTVEYQPIQHNLLSNDPDDAVNLLNKVYVNVDQVQEFSLANAPSGQNLFLMFTTANPTVVDNRVTGVSIIATGKDPANQSTGVNITTGDTINTSQAGGPTTFGTNSQMITEQEGIRFSFVTGAKSDFTIPNLDQNEADVESNIDFTGVFGARTASFDVVQLQSGKSAQVKITALNTALESGVNFIDGYTNDSTVTITNVRVLKTGTNPPQVIENSDGSVNDPGVNITISSGIATVTGVLAGYTIEYTTTGTHNRVLVENGAALNASGNTHADFDIGGFKLVQSSMTVAEVGSQMIFEDDGPTAVVSNAVADTLTLDESALPPAGDGVRTTTAQFADNFDSNTGTAGNQVNYGADGAGSVAYKLELSTTGVATGLYALDASAVNGKGAQIVLSQTTDGVVHGSVGTTEYFTISVDSTGAVTFTQSNNIWHGGSGNDDVATLQAAALSLKITQTVTDRDADTSAASIDLSSGVFKIEDDGPRAVVSNAVADTLTLDESALPPAGDGVRTITAQFADNFDSDTVTAGNQVNYGTDGAGSVAYKLELSSASVGSGLYALDASNTVNGKGAQILLSQTADGVIHGSAGTTEYFTISVDSTGAVTFTQSNNIWHGGTSNDDVATLQAAALSLKITQTVTDRDGDASAASIDLSSGVFKIEDDGPTAVVSNAVADTLTLDESALPPAGDGVRTVTAQFADNFDSDTVTAGNQVNYGTDGAGSVGYRLQLSTTGVATGLYALAASAVDGKGGQILLSQTADGVVHGTAGTTEYFTISVDSTGAVTFAQTNNIWHGGTTSNDDVATLQAAALSLKITQTVSDRDADTSTASIDLSNGVFKIEDDGPTVTTSPVKDTDPTLGTTQWTYSGDFAYSVGTDQNGPTYSATNSDFASLVLSGLANDVAIGTPTVTWVSETSSLATFSVSFNYDDDHNGTSTKPVAGQLVFDKSNHTYTVTLDALQVSQDVTLSGGTGYQTYDINGTAPSSGPSPVATGKLGDGFYLQITGFESPLHAGNNTAFADGEQVTGTVAPVTLSSTALGVSGNTIQSGEAANLAFFATDPKGNVSATNFVNATDFYIKFDGIETETDDLILVLNLVDPTNAAHTTTRAMYVDQGDIYESDTSNAGLVGTKYQPIVATLDNNDGLLIVESNDYNVVSGEQWVLRGLQILSNDAGLTGSAINLNRAVGINGGSSYQAVPTSGLVGPGNTIAEDSSTNPLKIIDAGFSTAKTTPPTLDLTLNFKVVDADGDASAVQTIDIDYPATVVGVV